MPVYLILLLLAVLLVGTYIPAPSGAINVDALGGEGQTEIAGDRGVARSTDREALGAGESERVTGSVTTLAPAGARW